MEKMTVAQAAIQVLQASQQPMSATDITQAIGRMPGLNDC